MKGRKFLVLQILLCFCFFSLGLVNLSPVEAFEKNLENNDELILKYYEKPSIEDNFLVNKINVVLKSSHSDIKEIGFEAFKELSQTIKILSITQGENTIHKYNEKLPLLKMQNQILLLEMPYHM